MLEILGKRAHHPSWKQFRTLLPSVFSINSLVHPNKMSLKCNVKRNFLTREDIHRCQVFIEACLKYLTLTLDKWGNANIGIFFDRHILKASLPSKNQT